MPVEIPPRDKHTVPEPFARGPVETIVPPAPRAPTAHAAPLLKRRRPGPHDMPRLGTRPTPFEKALAWAAWSKAENARQAAAAKEKDGAAALAELRARRAGLPWPPESA